MGHRQPQQSGKHIYMFMFIRKKPLILKCQLLRQNVVGGTNKATITGGLLIDGVTTCNTKQINVIADTQVLGKITLISGEITSNLPFSGPVKNTYMAVGLGTVSSDGRLDGGKRFVTLEDAQTQCSLDEACTGVTKEVDNLSGFTKRKGSLNPSFTKEISWAKIAATAGQALPWNINTGTNTGDWVISK
jgi:hypothetical protein